MMCMKEERAVAPLIICSKHDRRFLTRWSVRHGYFYRGCVRMKCKFWGGVRTRFLAYFIAYSYFISSGFGFTFLIRVFFSSCFWSSRIFLNRRSDSTKIKIVYLRHERNRN